MTTDQSVVGTGNVDNATWLDTTNDRSAVNHKFYPELLDWDTEEYKSQNVQLFTQKLAVKAKVFQTADDNDFWTVVLELEPVWQGQKPQLDSNWGRCGFALRRCLQVRPASTSSASDLSSRFEPQSENDLSTYTKDFQITVGTSIGAGSSGGSGNASSSASWSTSVSKKLPNFGVNVVTTGQMIEWDWYLAKTAEGNEVRYTLDSNKLKPSLISEWNNCYDVPPLATTAAFTPKAVVAWEARKSTFSERISFGVRMRTLVLCTVAGNFSWKLQGQRYASDVATIDVELPR